MALIPNADLQKRWYDYVEKRLGHRRPTEAVFDVSLDPRTKQSETSRISWRDYFVGLTGPIPDDVDNLWWLFSDEAQP